MAGTVSTKSGGRCINVQLYFLISGSINAATDFVLLALVSERRDGFCPLLTNEESIGLADTHSLAFENQSAAETRPDWDLHRRPHVSRLGLLPLHSYAVVP